MKSQSGNARLRDPFAAVRSEFERRLSPSASQRSCALSVIESPENVLLEFDVPGLHEGDLKIVFEDGVLTISGERRSCVPEGGTVVHDERRGGKFSRTVRLSNEVDPDSIDAVLDSGVLSIHLSKREELKPREIVVRAPHARTDSTGS